MGDGKVYEKYIKRPLDILIALLAIIILMPLFIIIALLIRIHLGKPVLFIQRRSGKNHKLFKLYKFRTMSMAKNEKGELLPDSERLSTFGRFLRSTSIDELPELFNILRGDMSIVGPRPLLEEYLPLYNEKQDRRHKVRPGLTGLAQIKGRNLLSWEERFEYDVAYVEGITFLGDMKIIAGTIKKVLLREGISSGSAVTMEPFRGNVESNSINRCKEESSAIGLKETMSKDADLEGFMKVREDDGNKVHDRLLIMGAGGHGRVIADLALSMKKWKQVAFLDDNSDLQTFMNLPILGRFHEFMEYVPDYDIFVAIGNNLVRERMINKLQEAGANIPVLIHPSAIIGRQVEIGAGSVVMAGAVINCCSRIGRGCIINTGATLDHDNWIEDYVHISPGVHTAGSVCIRKGTWLGIGSSVINNITIHASCTIGAGAVVVKDILEEGTYLGVPAKKRN